MASIPSPGDVPFDICAPLPNGNKLCVKSSDIVEAGPKPCQSEPGGTTPPLVTVNVTIAEETISLIGDSEVVVSESVYIGIEQDGGCFYVGQATAEQCASFCPDIPNVDPAVTTIGELADQVVGIAEDVVDDIEDQVGFPDPGTAAEDILIAFVVIVVAALILAPPTGVPG